MKAQVDPAVTMPGPSLAGVQGDVHLGIEQMERMDHLHLQR